MLDFDFWLPVETESNIKKSDTGKEEIDIENMYLKGLASTEDVDLDNQIMKSDGFDISYLLERGFINWHHQSKNYPSAIIGEPIEAKIVNQPKKGLFVKAKLYDTPVAVEAFNLARILEKQSPNRRLGFSIEGKILEKKGDIITKAKLTGIALTHAPKNMHTFAEICKAMQDADYANKIIKTSFDDKKIVIQTNSGVFMLNKEGDLHFIEKSLQADGNGMPLKKESLETKTKLLQPSLSVVLDKVFSKYPEIDFEKALKVAFKVIENKK